MKLVKMFKKLIANDSPSETGESRSIVIMQREAHLFGYDELQEAAERGWRKRFDGKEDPMYFVSVNHPELTVVKAGAHIIRVTSIAARYADDDTYALSQSPHPEQKRAWLEHQACTSLDLFNDLVPSRSIPDAEAYASLATLAVQLGNPNCTAIFLPIKNLMLPNDGTAEQGLRLMANRELPL